MSQTLRSTKSDAGLPTNDTIGAERFIAYMHALAANGFKVNTLYPGLGEEPWLDPSRFDVVARLEAAATDIQREASALDPLAFHPEAERIGRKGSWDILFLYERGLKRPANCRRCPTATGVVETEEVVRSLAGSIYFSRLRPGTHIAAHRGPTNVRVRCHLPLSVPRGDCALRVAEESRRWVTGRCSVFNDSLRHEAWNLTRSDRVVLVVDLWHPDLTKEEVGLLRGLHQYAFSAAQGLQRFWSMNRSSGQLRAHYSP